ncbi:MAG: biopolymer transporter ExbD [Moraxellaceae bacterium]|nr:biopolymer transporter ExbD [Pseudobdellovibrionaceae bacterium]
MGASFETDDQDDSTGAGFSSINVTPFVDVMLVLLVIFMITAPMLIKDIIDIKLPKTATSDGQKAELIGIAINKDGQVLLNGNLVDDENLKSQIKEMLLINPNTQGVISADVELPYGKVVRVIDQLKIAGLDKFAVQIEKEETK